MSAGGDEIRITEDHDGAVRVWLVAATGYGVGIAFERDDPQVLKARDELIRLTSEAPR